MQIKEISVKNFRGLQDIKVTKPQKLNVIVGPNAIGKSTLLDAIRLSKTILAQRFQNEGQQVLVNMSALSVFNQAIGNTGLDLATLANDGLQEVRLTLSIELSADEIDTLKNMQPQLALLALQTSMALQGDATLALTQFLSTQEGQTKFREATAFANSKVSSLQFGHRVSLDLTLDARSSTVRGEDDLGQSIVTILDRRLPFHQSLFSLFPADRQFPAGEQPIQLGAGDAQNQLLSHMANPGLKYQRLKQIIIQNLMLGVYGIGRVEQEFNLIFENLLPGKKLSGISINDHGFLKVLVTDIASGKIFDIDQMSSGEKGLVLTFLIIRLAIAKGGIALIDEPELHLNSSVQAKIMPFIKTYCVLEQDIQVFICTHSPEIVKDAFEDDECSLYHLRSPTDLTPILKEDQQELFDVFERLGSSTADVLFSKGNIFVEGVDDNQILQAGYGGILTGFKVTPLGGRGDIEREAPNLKAEEQKGRLKRRQLFMLDNDRKETKLTSSSLVKIYQHKRYCMENYLLNETFIFDLIKRHAKTDPGSRGSFAGELEKIAFDQIDNLALREAYLTLQPASPGLRNEDLKDRSAAETADVLASRLDEIKAALGTFKADDWKAELLEKTNERKQAIKIEWKSAWRDLASGKEIIDDLYIKYQISLRKPEFKKDIMKRMATEQTDDWRIIGDVLRSGLGI